MAEENKDELELEDFGDDLGLDDELGDFSFDDGLAEPPPPKDTREAISRSVKDASSSFKDTLGDDKLKTALDIAKESIPNSLSSETAEITTIADSIKDEFNEAGQEVRKQAKSTFNVIKKFVPQGNEKVDSVMEKIGRLVEGDDSSGEATISQDQINADIIANELQSSLGAKEESEATEDLIKHHIELNRTKAQIDVLSMISANTEKLRKFELEITNSYYRKTLELQFKNIFINKDMLETTKKGFETFKNQLEAITNNTALPETVKLRNSERISESIRTRFSEGITDLLYSDMNPAMRIKQNLRDKITGAKESIISGMAETENAGELLASTQGMGMSNSAMAGVMIAEQIKSSVGNLIGKQLEKSDTARNIIGNVKEKTSDISGSIREHATDVNNEYLNRAYNEIADILDTKQQEKLNHVKKDVNDASFFDNRTHNSINKVIPGYLAKLVAITTNIMNGAKADDKGIKEQELVYNHRTDKMETRAEIKNSVMKRVTKTLEIGFGKASEIIITTITQHGGDKFAKVHIDEYDYETIKTALMKYARSKRFSTNPAKLADKQFTKFLPERLQPVINKAVKKTMLYARERDLSIISTLKDALTTLYKKLPSLKGEILELEAMGVSDIASELNILDKKKMKLGQYEYNNQGLTDMLVDASKKMDKTRVRDLVSEDEAAKEAKEKKKKPFFKKPTQDEVNPVSAKGFSEGGYTGDGAKNDYAGPAHKGEYYFTKKDLKELLANAKSGDFKAIGEQLKDVAIDVKNATNNSNLKKTADEAIKTFKTEADVKFNKVMDKVSSDAIPAAELRVLKKHYHKSGSTKSFNDYLATDGAKLLVTKKGKEVRNFTRDKKNKANILMKKTSIKAKHTSMEDIKKLLSENYSIVTKHLTGLNTRVTKSLTEMFTTSGNIISNVYTNTSERAKTMFNGMKTFTKEFKELSDEFGFVETTKATAGVVYDIGKEKATGVTNDLANKSKELYNKNETVKRSVDKSVDAFNTVKEKKDNIIKDAKKKVESGEKSKTAEVIVKIDKAINNPEGVKEKVIDKTKETYDKVKEVSKDKTKVVKERVETLKKDTTEAISKYSVKLTEMYGEKLTNMLIKKYNKLYRSEMSFEDFMLKHGHLMVAKNKTMSQKGKAKKMKKESQTLFDSFRKNTWGYTESEIEDMNFVKKFDDLTDDEKDALKSEFFSSTEYRENNSLKFHVWLSQIKSIDPGSLKDRGMRLFSELKKKIDPLLNFKKKFNDFKDEALEELTGKITGKGLKELSVEEEEYLRKDFFNSEEYATKRVVDFDQWLKAFGYRRNGTGLFGRLKKKFTLKNILRKARDLDRKIFFGGAKLLGKAPVALTKGAYNLGVDATKAAGYAGVNTVRGLVGLNKLTRKKRVKEAPKSIFGKIARGGLNAGMWTGGKLLKGSGKLAFGTAKTIAEGFLPNQDKLVAENVRAQKFYKNPFAGDWTEASKEAQEHYDSKRKFWQKDLQTQRDEIKKKKKEEESKNNENKESYTKKLFDFFIKKDTKENKEKIVNEKKAKKEARAKAKAERKSSLKERFFSSFGGDKDKKSKGDKKQTLLSKGVEKAKGLISPVTILLAISAAMKALGVNMDGIKKGLGTVKDILTGIWDTAKAGFDAIKNLPNYIMNLPGNISFYLRKALSNIPGLGSLAPTKEEAAMNKAKNNGTYDKLYTKDGKLKEGLTSKDVKKAEEEAKTSNGELAVYAGAGYAAHKLGATKAIKGTLKFAGKKSANIVGKKPSVKTKVPDKGSVIKKIKTSFKILKDMAIKKLGPNAGGKLVKIIGGKAAMRLVPIAGLALLAYDAAMTIKYMVQGYKFKSAFSKAFLGFDIFGDDVPVDDNGNPIKGDENYNKIKEDLEKDEKKNKDKEDEKSSFLDGLFGRKKKDNSNDNSNGNNSGGFFSRMFGGSNNNNSSNSNSSGSFDNTPLDLSNVKQVKVPKNKKEVIKVIEKASQKAGVSSDVMKTFAAIESNFNPVAKAPTSSASGLFQFITKTWNAMLRKYGKKYNLPMNTSPFDAEANALMGAEYIKENERAISGVKPNPNVTDLYMAHFMGAGGARTFFKMNPESKPARTMRASAKANKTIFFKNKGRGEARTANEIYKLMKYKTDKKAKMYGLNTTGSAVMKAINNSNYSPMTTIDADKKKVTLDDINIKDIKKSDKISKVKETKDSNNTPKLAKAKSVTPTTTTTVTSKHKSKIKPKSVTPDDLIMAESTTINKDSNTQLAKTRAATEQSVSIQQQMLSTLGVIADRLNGGINVSNLDKLNTNNSSTNSTDQQEVTLKSEPTPTVAANNKELPDPTIDLKRKKYM